MCDSSVNFLWLSENSFDKFWRLSELVSCLANKTTKHIVILVVKNIYSHNNDRSKHRTKLNMYGNLSEKIDRHMLEIWLQESRNLG